MAYAVASTRKMSEKEVAKWKALLAVAADYQKKKGNFVSGSNMDDGRWDVNIKALDGDFNSRSELGEEAVDVNVTHSTVQTLLSPMWTTQPHITIEPTMARVQDGDEDYDNILHADLTEHEINYWMRELEVPAVVKKCVLDNAATNAGYAYVGYVAEKKDIENDEGEETEPEPQIRLKQPFVKRVSPKNVLIPPGYYEIEEAPWVAVGFSRCVEDVRDRYGVSDLKGDVLQYDSSTLIALEGLSSASREYLESEDSGYVTVWQLWDKRSRKLLTFTMSHEDALEVEDWPFDVEGFPLIKQRFTMTPDQQFGMPVMSAWIAQQKELNAARTATRKREARTKSTVYLLDAPAEVEAEIRKSPDGTLINLKNSQVEDIKKFIYTDQGLPPASSAYSYGAVSMQDLFTISGLGSNQRSQGDPNAGSATESALIDKWAQIRQTDYGDVVRKFYLEIAKKIWMILKQFPDQKRDMLVVGKTGTLQRITYTLADLRGEFAFTMDLGQMTPQDPVTRRQNAYARYNLMRADPLVRGDRLIADALKADNIHDIDGYMTKLLSPQEEFMKMLQGLPVEANEQDDQIAHQQAHEQQGQQLEQLIATSQAGSPQETQARTAMFMLLAHVNDHARITAALDTKAGSGAGKPVAENMLRQDANAGSGETAAEMKGGAVGNESVQTPAGIGVK